MVSSRCTLTKYSSTARTHPIAFYLNDCKSDDLTMTYLYILLLVSSLIHRGGDISYNPQGQVVHSFIAQDRHVNRLYSQDKTEHDE